MHLFLSRGHLGLAAAVDEMDLLRAEPESHAACIHRDVSAAEHRDALAVPEGGVVSALVIGLHEVGARQVFVGAEDSDKVLALDVHELGESRAGADEHRVEAVLHHEVAKLARAPDHEVHLELDAEGLESVDLLLDDRLRQTELRDAVD